MYRLGTTFGIAVALMASPNPASAQDLAKTREALEIISQAADKVCLTLPTRGKNNEIALSGEGKAELNGLIAKLANLGFSGGVKYSNKEYEGVLQEQLGSLLLQSQTCKQLIFNKLADALLASTSDRSIAAIEADIALYCGRLRGWPHTSSNEETVGRLEGLLKEIESQRNNARSRSLALVNRCMGASYLTVAGELPDKIRNALPYLNRSLVFDPDQSLLRENIAILERLAQTGHGDADQVLTAMVQVIRGSNDPDIPDLVKQIKSVLQKNN